MSLCAQKTRLHRAIFARTRHALRVHVPNVAWSRTYMCRHCARGAKRTARTCARALYQHEDSVQHRQALNALPL